MSIIYYAHSYRDRDARVVDFFGRLMRSEGLTPSLDPPSDAVNVSKLQRHLNASDGMIAVLSARDGGVSPHILFEISLCLRSRKPLLVFLEDRVANAIPARILQRRFSHKSHLRQVREHRHAVKVFKTYLPGNPLPDYQPPTERRSCLLLGFDAAPAILTQSLVQLLEADLEYTPLVVGSGSDSGSWHVLEATPSAELALTYLDGLSSRSSYLTGVAAGGGVPMIELTANPNYRFSKWPPAEYQARKIGTSEEVATELVTAEIALFEEDFLDLHDQQEVERYTQLLVDLQGSYDAHTRHDAMEVVMGDKYVTGQAGAVGPGASAQHMTFNQVWTQNEQQINLDDLVADLSRLRQDLKARAVEPEHDMEVAAVAAAEVAAKQGDGPKALQSLSRVSNWALAAATSIGTAVAAAAIKAAAGI